MAFKKKENIFFIGLMIVTAITLPLVATQNIDCKGKAFYCVNSTHFKICVDLGGGVSTTIDDFLIPCPKSTVCKDSNYFECEYHPTTTLKPTQLSEVTNDQISETPILENFDLISTFNGSISDIELSEVIISTTPTPEFSSTTLTIDSAVDPKKVTSVISDSATYNNIINTVTEVSLNDEELLSTTTGKVILDNTELNFTESINYTSHLFSSEKNQSTDSNVSGASLNTYLASDVTEVYTKNNTTLFSNTLTNHIDEDNFNHISSKNESFSLPSSENISVNKTANISSSVSTTEIEPNSSTTKKIVNNFSAENILRSSLYDKVTKKNIIASSINMLSTISEDQFTPFNLLQNEISITTDRNVNIEYHQEKLFTAAQSNIWKENTIPESILVANSFNDLNKNNILPSTEKSTTNTKYESSIQYLPTVKNIFYHQTEYMPTTTETQDYFLKERVVTNINDAYIDNLSIFNYESITESNSNYEIGHSREELNISTQNVSETLNYSLSDSQLSMSSASNEYISFKGNPLQNTIYDEINNVSSLPSTVSKSETVIKTLNNKTEPINYYYYTSKYDENIILTQTESISKTDSILSETTEVTADKLQTPTTISPIEFSNQLNLEQNSLLSTLQKPNNSKELAGDTFIELQANTTDSYSTLHDENPLQSTSIISIIKNNIQTEPVNIKLPAINVSKINRTHDTRSDIDINKDIKTTTVNAGNINNFLAVIDKPVGTHITIINVSDVLTTVGFNSSKEDKTNIETLIHDSEKISTTVSTLVAGKYPSFTDLNVTSNIEIHNNFEFRDKTLTAGTTEPYVRVSEITDASLWTFENTTIRDAENTTIDKIYKINTIITEEKHTSDTTVSDISISGSTDISLQTYNNVNSQDKGDMYINNDINLRKLSTEVKSGDKVTEFYVKITQSTPKSIQTQSSTTTVEAVDAIINNNNEKNILTFNGTDITLGEHISDKKIPDVNTVRSTDVNRMEYNNNVNVNSSNKINMQIFNSTNEIDKKFVTKITGLVLNDSTSSNLNMDSPITDKKLTYLNFENIYKAPDNVKLNGEELKIDTTVSAVHGSQTNITSTYDSNDISQINFIDIHNVIQTTDKSIQTYDNFKVKHDQSITDTINVSFINGTDITVHAHKNILLSETKLKTDNTEADSTVASINSLTTKTYYYNKTREMTFVANDTAKDGDIVDNNEKTLPTMVYDVSLNIRADTNVQQNDTIFEKNLEKAVIITQPNDLKTQMRNNTEVNQLKLNAYISADVNVTIDSEDNIQTNNSMNKVDFFTKSTVSDVITESTKIAMLNSNIDEIKEMTLIAGATIPDLNFTEENINSQTYNNTLTKQLNIEDNITLDKNLTKDIDKTMQTHYNIDPNVTKHMKFGLNKTTASVTKTFSKSIADLNLDNYNNSEVNLYFMKDRAVDMYFANNTNKRIQTDNTTESKEIILRIYNINATATDNINMQTYNNTRDSQLNFKTVQDLSNNKGVNVNMQAFNKNDAEIRDDIAMINMAVKENNIQMFNNTLANENITERNDVYIQTHSDTPIESSKFIAEHTILGFNITQSTDVNLNTSTTVDIFNIKSSAKIQQTYNNTQMQDMISMSDVTFLNKSEGNTKQNNIIKDKGISIQSYHKDTANQTYPKDIKNQTINLEKLQSNQTSTSNNNPKTPYMSKLEESTSFYPVIVKEIDTDSGTDIAKNKPNLGIAHSSNLDSDIKLRNPLDIYHSKKSFEIVTLSSSEIKVYVIPKVASDAPYINDFTLPSESVISNSNYNIENTLENLSTKSRPLSKLETLNSNNNKLLNNKTVSEMNGDKSNFNRTFKINTTTPSSKIEPIKIIDYVKNIKLNEEVSEDNKYLEMPPNNKNKQWIVTTTEKSALNQSDYFVQHINLSLPTTTFTCNVSSRGKYSDKNDCNKFYICIGKLTPIIGRCPGDTVFSEINKQCTRNLSHCIRNNQFSCIAEGRFIDVLSNNFYYICTKSSKGFLRFKLKCQEGYRLNTDTIQCTIKPSSIEDDSKNTGEKTKEKLSSESDISKKSFACEKEGLYEFPGDCRKYFLCIKKSKSEFRRKIKKCDSDEVFDKDKQKCVDEDSHEEMNDDKCNYNRTFKKNITTPASKIEPIQISDYVKNIKLNEEVSEDNKYLEMPPNNKNKQWIVTTTEKSALNQSDYFVQHINLSLPTTTFTCNVSSRGKYSDKNDCNKFYICIGKLTPIIGRCPGDTVFSEINKQCTRNLSHCIRNNQFSCIAEGRFIDVLSNNFYYICTKSSKGFLRFKLKCQEGYRLNTDTIQCTIKPSSIEDDSENLREKSTKDKLSSESDISKKNFACEKEGLFEFPDDCRKYFICTQTSKSEFRRKIKKCDSDEVFDKDKQKCVDEDSHEGN